MFHILQRNVTIFGRRYIFLEKSTIRPLFNPYLAIRLLKDGVRTTIDETFDVDVTLNVDPQKQNQAVRGSAILPNGTGKKVNIAVFARGDDAAKAIQAGALVVGAEDLVEQVVSGNINFDKCIATPEVLPIVSKIAKILGPRGLMPNIKMGTVTKDVIGSIQALKQGQITFKTDRKGSVRSGFGKASFSEEALLENLRSFMIALANSRPEVVKGRFIKAVYLSTTMGKSYKIDLPYIDPASAKFMLRPPKFLSEKEYEPERTEKRKAMKKTKIYGPLVTTVAQR